MTEEAAIEVRVRAVVVCRSWLVALLLCLAAARAGAAPIACAQDVSLDELIALGSEGCSGGHGRFFDFRYAIAGSDDAIEVAASEIAVEFLATRFGQPAVFIGSWTVDPGQSLDVLIGFRFADIRVRGATVSAPGEIGLPPAGTTTIEGWLCVGAGFPCDDGVLIHLDPGTAVLPHVADGSVELLLSVRGTAPDERIVVPRVGVGLSVPEPSLLLLVVCGVLGHRLHAARARRSASLQVT